MASILVSRISFLGHHGVSAAERENPRRFEVDVEIAAHVEAAERSDRLGDTLDYTEISEIVIGIGTGAPHHLIEALARKMVDSLAERFKPQHIRLELRKLHPPGCPGDPAYAAVRLER